MTAVGAHDRTVKRTVGRQAAALCGSFLLHKTTIGQRKSRCPRSCQSDAAPLFPEQPEGELVKALLYATNCAGLSERLLLPLPLFGNPVPLVHDLTRRRKNVTWFREKIRRSPLSEGRH